MSTDTITRAEPPIETDWRILAIAALREPVRTFVSTTTPMVNFWRWNDYEWPIALEPLRVYAAGNLMRAVDLVEEMISGQIMAAQYEREAIEEAAKAAAHHAGNAREKRPHKKKTEAAR